MKILVTGGAGFIGSSLAKRLVKENHNVTIIDDFSSGDIENLSSIIDKIDLCETDCMDKNLLKNKLEEIQVVFHFAANPDARIEKSSTENTFNRNILLTHKILEAVKESNVERIFFSSTSTVYGDTKIIPTPIELGEKLPISFYGASKLASEALLSAYAHIFEKQVTILRLANVVGGKSNHGITFDFYNKLKKNSSELEILGDGKQTKSYLHIDDLVDGLLLLLNKNNHKVVDIYNIGSSDQVTVTRIAEIIAETMNIRKVKFKFTEGSKDGGGWKGDVTKMLLDNSKIKKLGWDVKYNSEKSIKQTIEEILEKRN